MPTNWRGQSYSNFTTVQKLEEDLYQVATEVKVTKTVKIGDRCWDDANIILEKLVSQTSYECTGENFTGELATTKYSKVRETFVESETGAVLAYNYEEATIKFPSIPNIINEGKFGLTSAIGELYPKAIGPALFKGASAATKMGAITAVALALPDLIAAGVNYATAENTIAKQQAEEQLWATGIGLGLSLAGLATGPYMLVFQLAWKGLIYGLDALGLIPAHCKVSTLASPEALIAFAITYLTGSPPSEISERALTEASKAASDWVAIHDAEDKTDLLHIYIPPKTN
jgi:hypothetical protein